MLVVLSDNISQYLAKTKPLKLTFEAKFHLG